MGRVVGENQLPCEELDGVLFRPDGALLTSEGKAIMTETGINRK